MNSATATATPAERLDAAREAADRYVQARAEYDRATTRRAGVPGDLVKREAAAELDLVAAIRAASADGGDPAEQHAFRHLDGRIFVAPPSEGAELLDCHDRGLCRILLIEPRRIAGA
jgi:hypothetical protein